MLVEYTGLTRDDVRDWLMKNGFCCSKAGSREVFARVDSYNNWTLQNVLISDGDRGFAEYVITEKGFDGTVESRIYNFRIADCRVISADNFDHTDPSSDLVFDVLNKHFENTDEQESIQGLNPFDEEGL